MRTFRTPWFFAFLCTLLVFGIYLGLNHFPRKASSPESSPESPASRSYASPETASHEALYSAALSVAAAVREGDFAALAAWTHKQKGVTFTAFSTVDPQNDPVLSAKELASLSEDLVHLWGVDPVGGIPIRLTTPEFFATYLQIRDFTTAPSVGFNLVQKKGHTTENVLTAYPEAQVVDLYFPCAEGIGLTWASLKLAFEDEGGQLQLVGIVRSVYTEQ